MKIFVLIAALVCATALTFAGGEISARPYTTPPAYYYTPKALVSLPPEERTFIESTKVYLANRGHDAVRTAKSLLVPFEYAGDLVVGVFNFDPLQDDQK